MIILKEITMKKYTAFLSTLLILTLVVTGCFYSRDETIGTAKPSLAKNTISPTATVSLTLDEETFFDQEAYSIVIPENAQLHKNGNVYSWVFTSNDYAIMLSISFFGTIVKTQDIIASDASLNTIITALEASSNNGIKMDTKYKRTTFCGKNAIYLSGKFINGVNGDFEVYYMDTSKGLLSVSIGKAYRDNSDEAKGVTNNAVNDIIKTLIIK